MKKIIFTSFTLILLISCAPKHIIEKRQKSLNYIPYYLKVYEADSLFYTNNYTESYAILNYLFKTYKPVNMLAYREYETYVRLAVLLNKKLDKKTVLNLFSDYGIVLQQVKKDSLLNVAINKTKITNKDLELERKKYLSKLDFALRKQIIEMVNYDQEFRRKALQEKGRIDSLDVIQLQKIDSVNFVELKRILDKQMPNENAIGKSDLNGVGNYELTDIFPLVNHLSHNHSYYKYLKNKLLFYMKKGKADPYLLAVLSDAKYTQFINYKDIYIKDSLNATYRNSINSLYFFGRYDVMSKFNTKLHQVINLNRKKIGMPSIEQELFWRAKFN